MNDHDRAPLLKEAFQSYVQERDPILAAPRKSYWSLIKEAAERAWNEETPPSFKDSWTYAWTTAAKHGFRNIKTALHQFAFLKPLKTGEKKSVGHVVPRHESSHFAPIDRAIWHEGKVDIMQSKVTAEDVGYAGVRILKTETAPSGGPAPMSQGPDDGAKANAKRNPGAPTLRDLTFEILDKIGNTEDFRAAKTVKEKTAQIRKAANDIEDEALRNEFINKSDKTLIRHLDSWLAIRSNS